MLIRHLMLWEFKNNKKKTLPQQLRKFPMFIAKLPTHWLSGRGFAKSPGDRGSISGRVIPKTQKMILDISLHNTQHYNVCSKGKVEQSREKSSALPYTSVQ